MTETTAVRTQWSDPHKVLKECLSSKNTLREDNSWYLETGQCRETPAAADCAHYGKG